MDGEVVATVIPHSVSGDPNCCGCLNGIVRGEEADFICNECEAVVRTVPAADLRQALADMELSLDLVTAMCPYCRSVNLLAGFSEVTAFVCHSCGNGVNRPGESGNVPTNQAAPLRRFASWLQAALLRCWLAK